MNKDKFKRVYVEITNECNLNCKFCNNTLRHKEQMNIYNFEHILKELKGKTKYIYLHVKGEPLLHQKLPELIDKANEYGMFVVITTNGVLLNKWSEELSKKKNIRQINISLHSVSENNKSKEYIKEYLNKVTNAAENINDKTGAYISYRVWNIDDIQKSSTSNMILEYIEQKYGVENIKEKIKSDSKIELKNKVFMNVDNVFVWPSNIEGNKEVKGNCYGLITQMAILVDGTVVPCCLDSEAHINLGNIFNDSLDNILGTRRSKNIIEGFKKKESVEDLCKKCTFKILKRK